MDDAIRTTQYAILILFFLFSPASANNRFVAGQVIDVAGNPIAQATIFVRGDSAHYTFVSDDDGAWSGQITAGDYRWYATADGDQGQPWSAPRHLAADSATDLQLNLAPTDNAVTAGDFEADGVWQDWSVTRGSVALSDTAFDGSRAIQLGHQAGYSVSCFQNNAQGELWTIAQTVRVPNVNPTLSFAAKIETDQTEFDYGWLEVVVETSDDYRYVIPWGDLWQNGDWTLYSGDLTPWAGQEVSLLVQAVNCGAHQFTAWVDRVSVGSADGPVSSPTATPTPRVTTTPIEGTATPSPDATATPIHTPSHPNADYIASVRQLTACENEGKHHLFIYVEDEAGNGIPEVEVRVSWPGNQVDLVTGTKMEHAGLVDFAMFKGNYWVEVLDGSSEQVGPLTPDIPEDQLCETSGNPVGNSLFHYSYEVIFTKR